MDTIVIVANLGRLKAYRIENTPTRGRKLDLIDDMELIDSHLGLGERFTDQSGRFQKTVTAGQRRVSHLSAYEAKTVELEIQRRLIRLVAEQISAILLRERAEMWYFAAAAEVHDQILDGIPQDLFDRMSRALRSDLVNVPPGEILARFQR